jgi:serine/threonine-protein kinase RsbT
VITSGTGKSGVRVGFTDDGPGIADLDLALTDGWTSGGGLGLGLGLSGARRLVDEFELTSKPGSGTSVVVVKWSR